MKTLMIGEKAFKLLENTKEISVKRNLEIELYKLKGDFHGADTEDVTRKIDYYIQAFDRVKMSDCLIYLYELKSGIKQIVSRFNPYHYVFALIVLEEEEEKNQHNESFLSGSYLEEKINRLCDLGLTEGLVEEVVVNFRMSSAQNVEAALLRTFELAALPK